MTRVMDRVEAPGETHGLAEKPRALESAPEISVFLPVYNEEANIIPLSRKGPNTIKNAQLLCEPCNLSKNDKTMEEWAAWKAKVKASVQAAALQAA